jgi:hypothetical protein
VGEQNEQAKKPDQPKLETVRSEEFENLYSNNVQFEATLWDLRLFLGQVDLGDQKIVQHTAVNLPWPQAKIAAYFMLVNVVIHQALNGPTVIPQSVIPPRPDPSDPANAQFNKGTLEYLGWIHDQFFGTDPYVPPAVAACDQPTETQV